LDFRVITLLVLVLAGAGIVASRVHGLSSPVLNSGGTPKAEDVPAPSFQGITAWLNSPPLTVEALRGKVVLVDFWTYSCINCIRTLPFLRSFYAHYQAFGLEIVGVHSPEFEFEKVRSNVAAAVKEHRVVWPVAMDNDLRTWDAYANRYWPHVYLIDRNGHIRYDFIGEGHDEELQASIRTLLGGAGVTLPQPAPLPWLDLAGEITPEIYLGYQRGRVQGTLWNPEGYSTEVVHNYHAPSQDLIDQAGPSGAFFLVGSWVANQEYLQSGSGGAILELTVRARDVYVVGGADGPGEATVQVLLDGRPVRPSAAGEDVREGLLHVGLRDLYHVVHLPDVQTHFLTLVAQGSNVDLFTFTFG